MSSDTTHATPSVAPSLALDQVEGRATEEMKRTRVSQPIGHPTTTAPRSKKPRLSAGMKLCLYFYTVCCALAVVGWYFPSLALLSVLPLVMVVKKMKITLISGIVVVVVWTLYDSALLYFVILKPLNYFFGVPMPPLSFLLVNVYFPVLFAVGFVSVPRKGFKKYLFHVWMDAPILISVWLSRMVFRDRLLLPFMTYVGDTGLIVGSMPLAVDVAELKKEGVTHVVNMCAEYSGPVSAFDKFGIQHIRLPTVEMTPPSESSLLQGVEFIHQAFRSNPKSKVFVHCKGGQGRASAMAAAYLILCRRMTAREAVDLIRVHRPGVWSSIARYPVLRGFELRRMDHLMS